MLRSSLSLSLSLGASSFHNEEPPQQRSPAPPPSLAAHHCTPVPVNIVFEAFAMSLRSLSLYDLMSPGHGVIFFSSHTQMLSATWWGGGGGGGEGMCEEKEA